MRVTTLFLKTSVTGIIIYEKNDDDNFRDHHCKNSDGVREF